MDDEFDKLMKYFDAEYEKKEKNIEAIFQQSMQFFKKYKHILVNGGEEEKKEMKKKMDLLRAKLKEESEKSQAALNMSAEEVKQLSNDPKYFSSSQWEFLVGAQKEIQEERIEHEAKIKTEKEARKRELRSKMIKKTTTKKSNWMKS